MAIKNYAAATALAATASVFTAAIIKNDSPKNKVVESRLEEKTSQQTSGTRQDVTKRNETKPSRHATLHGTKHKDGSTYADLMTAHVKPGDIATTEVYFPKGSKCDTSTLEYTDEAEEKFKTIGATYDNNTGRFALAAKNISGTIVKMTAVIRYQRP